MAREYFEIQIVVNASLVDHISGILSDLGALAVSCQDAQNSPILEPLPGEIRMWPKTIVTGLFSATGNAAAIRRSLEDAVGNLAPISSNWVDDRDWVRAWMDRFRPERYGEHLWIYPSWIPIGEHTPQDTVMVLDPGLAFGSGSHPTTAMCLAWLDAQDLRGVDVVDYGTGSGILSVAALRLGARHVWALDIEPQALTATAENARRNEVEGRLTLTAREEELVPCPLVICNIFYGPVMELEPALARLTLPGGRVLLSGLLKGEEDDVAGRYAPHYDIDEVRVSGEWILVVGTRLSPEVQ